MVVTETIEFKTRGDAEMIDITGDVAARVKDCGIDSGTVTIFCPGSTSAVTTIEYESGVVNDLRDAIPETD